MLYLLTLGAVVVLALGNCTYGNKNFRQTNGALAEPRDFVIQVDDYGAFRDASVATRALETIKSTSLRTNTIVVLFIHGWHHNADLDDQNAKDFSTTLSSLRKTLGDNENGQPGVYRQSRVLISGTGDIQVIGIYVGWRGKSMPMPLDYLTFWGRKAAAERVGDGDLREFLLRLNAIYLERNRPHAGLRPFMGMITVGHSFGGQVLFKAVGNTLEKELIDATMDPARGQLAQPLRGFGDIIVLVNPALEASQYARIDQLSREISFSPKQTPLLLVISSETDAARKYFFPAGRSLGLLFHAPLRPEQRAMWITALGEYEPQRTHFIELIDSAVHGFDPNRYRDDRCGILDFDLTDVPLIGGVKLSPLPARQRNRYSPFLIAYASNQVVMHHSGIFGEALRTFVSDYVGVTEGKRVLLSNQDLSNCEGR
jgi:pimeloyl-ACP methyl ester carboxylesterase